MSVQAVTKSLAALKPAGPWSYLYHQPYEGQWGLYSTWVPTCERVRLTWVRTSAGVYLRLARVALPFYSFLLALIVTALMLQSLACPPGHSLTFCMKTFQLKIVAPSINSLPLWTCFSSVRIPVEKMKNVFFFFVAAVSHICRPYL